MTPEREMEIRQKAVGSDAWFLGQHARGMLREVLEELDNERDKFKKLQATTQGS